MKYLILLLISISFLCLSLSLNAQSSAQFRYIEAPKSSPQGPSSLNPWQLGAKLSFAVKDLDGSLENNFIFAGKASAVIAQGDNYAFPLYGSIGLGSEDIFAPESGFNVGLYPYSVLSSTNSVRFLIHGGIGYKVIPATGDLEPASQFKLTAGIEAHLYSKEGVLPTTVSLAPTILWHNIIENTGALEATVIFPVSSGVGLLAEYLYPFKKDFDGILRIGIITVASLD